MAEYQAQNKAKLISDTRRRFEAEYVTEKSDKYDPRDVERLQQDDKSDKYDPCDVERLQQDDNWVESYLLWRHNVADETLKMLDESFQWRKEMSVNDLTEASIPRWLLEIGGIYLHGYDKEGNKLSAFKIVKSWLGPEAVSLLKFTSKSDIQDYVSVEYLPPHMGGTDPFKYSYPPLVDDDFQTPLCENGPIASEDEASSKEDIESDGKETLETISNEEQTALLKKVRTTAPEKYRVKPSNSSCDPGASIDIVVSPHGGLTVSAQDRFLIMAAEMEQSSGTGPAELTQFWKEVPRNKVMEHRYAFYSQALKCDGKALKEECAYMGRARHPFLLAFGGLQCGPQALQGFEVPG
ncbi:hypothetical protein CB1_000205002 [Camelus ferus]|nr:hypothetical protein CB1_000205002 [Camelus ferus]